MAPEVKAPQVMGLVPQVMVPVEVTEEQLTAPSVTPYAPALMVVQVMAPHVMAFVPQLKVPEDVIAPHVKELVPQLILSESVMEPTVRAPTVIASLL